jgi:hypothetical protein
MIGHFKFLALVSFSVASVISCEYDNVGGGVGHRGEGGSSAGASY